MNESEDKPLPAFPSTHWSVVLAAGHSSSPQAKQALETLCGTYWYPLYAFARRSGHDPQEAQDLTQGFFVHMLEARLLERADLARGRFRTYVLTCFRNYLKTEWKRAHAQKRGGAAALLNVSLDEAERQFIRESASSLTPERLYERSWAMTVLEQTLHLLKAEHTEPDQEKSWELLSPLLQGEHAELSYAQLATLLGTTEGALRRRVQRMRRRYRELLRSIIAHTVASPTETEEELQYLIGLLRG